ncbi:hypothetical protein [Patulibacter minatonensis]|uniref:hypothetical protein n=1 Tax=Patulibacter minatonensis TaxID=298163 RepID=UPI00047A8C18|nr:hypothetical protein [Patulibacter minatonensis]
MPVLTERNHLINLTSDSAAVRDAWMKFEGGNLTTETGKIRPGGMADAVPLAGLDDYEDIVLTREYDPIRDQTIRRALVRNAKDGAAARVVVQDLDSKKNAIGTPDSFSGVIKAVGYPQRDSESVTGQTWTVTVGSVTQ